MLEKNGAQQMTVIIMRHWNSDEKDETSIL